MKLTHKERFIKALKRQPLEGHVPTFELVFFLTMEKLGKVHPSHRWYGQWNQMSANEREAQLKDMAYCYTEIAKRYNHDAIFVHPNPGDFDSTKRLLEIIRETTGDEYYTMMHGDPTLPIPNGDDMIEFSARLYEDPEGIIAEQERNIKSNLEFSEKINKDAKLLDGYALCSDYCFNANPFYPREMFADLIAPPLKKVIDAYRSMGFYTIKHTDGNIMPIVDIMVDCGPDAIHSLDPQGGVSLKEVKKLYGDKVCLVGNVNCGLLQTGTDGEVIADTRRALSEGMDGWGYIFSTSNCAYTGMELSRYELMHSVWEKEGKYK